MRLEGKEMFNKYETYSDEQIVKWAKQGDEEAEEFLIRKYKDLVKGKANLYYIVGADKEDLMQEGMIGVFKAIKSFDSEKEASFYTFANLCVNRQIITAIKRAGRLKHLPLNNSISLNDNNEDDGFDISKREFLFSGSESDPEATLLLKELLQILEGKGEKILSNLEMKVMAEYLYGNSYLEIGNAIGISGKSVDNAVQRIRRKLAKYLNE